MFFNCATSFNRPRAVFMCFVSDHLALLRAPRSVIEDPTGQDGSQTQKVEPYLMDLESTNGSFLNNVKIEPRRLNDLMTILSYKYNFNRVNLFTSRSQIDSILDML